MEQKQLLEKLKTHKKFITSVMKWDVYAMENGLPNSKNLIYKFGSWTNLKKALDLSARKSAYTFEELEEILMEHKDFLRSKNVWDQHSKLNKLPASATLVKNFGKWSDLKKHFGLDNEKRKSDLYSKQDIELILKEHSDNYVNRTQWDIYAKENKLPTYKTIKKHFEYDEILKLVGKPKKFNFTEAYLIRVAKENEAVFFSASMNSWNAYAAPKGLPSSHTYLRKFDSWRKAKHIIKLKL
ncbi:hypothetical protein [Mesobacillus zeae]|uniref:hypothetical protein n=1 Tax=Mesobacillus zeae TaxID=1917180 RepID=UPI0030087F83